MLLLLTLILALFLPSPDPLVWTGGGLEPSLAEREESEAIRVKVSHVSNRGGGVVTVVSCGGEIIWFCLASAEKVEVAPHLDDGHKTKASYIRITKVTAKVPHPRTCPSRVPPSPRVPSRPSNIVHPPRGCKTEPSVKVCKERRRRARGLLAMCFDIGLLCVAVRFSPALPSYLSLSTLWCLMWLALTLWRKDSGLKEQRVWERKWRNS